MFAILFVLFLLSESGLSAGGGDVMVHGFPYIYKKGGVCPFPPWSN